MGLIYGGFQLGLQSGELEYVELNRATGLPILRQELNPGVWGAPSGSEHDPSRDLLRVSLNGAGRIRAQDVQPEVGAHDH